MRAVAEQILVNTRMASCSVRKLRSQACLILLALFLLARPLTECGLLTAASRSVDESAGSLAALAASLSPLELSLQSVRSNSWHQSDLLGPGKHLFVPRGRPIETVANDADRRHGTGPAPYIARTVSVQTGRSPPPILY